jgi:hypothetical protein
LSGRAREDRVGEGEQLDPGLITEAETIGEAFENARDALHALSQSRAKLLKKLQISRTGA